MFYVLFLGRGNGRLTWAFTCLLVLTQPAKAQGQAPLARYQWQNRLLLVFAPQAGHATYQRQLAAWQAEAAALHERDLLVCSIIGDRAQLADQQPLGTAETLAIRRFYRVETSQFTVLLIGKDGQEKLRRLDFLPNPELFSTIDAMPMRQTEMRRRHR
ncbi:MAG: DUF4174 domain-containing protein [Bernardetiaceae bacterium]|jgi:hypothetical protein|nr:DUF4174 domain-containing protein [Bernardetiaceae bacterium]